ncbi:helix-turn-helix domain-containing protein, partial [Salmonella enterica]|uniref:helix-turn-helix domain-containing protein n=1 Tax=Salmonella enterica TaxID=28901 RepID=UPI001D0C69C0
MTQRRDLQALIDAAPVGKMQWRVIICCFLVVMLDGFDTAAIGFIARMMNISQPALSKWLSQLEDEIGITLFERHSKGLRPSEGGK